MKTGNYKDLVYTYQKVVLGYIIESAGTWKSAKHYSETAGLLGLLVIS